MKRTKYLLVFLLPLIFMAGCIDGQAMLTLNKDGSGKVTFEGLFDYAAYCAATGANPAQAEPFFLSQIKEMLTNGEFEAWNKVSWKFLNDGRCYFRGTAYFKDINKTDFFIGLFKSNLKTFFSLQQKEPTLELKYSADDVSLENQKMELLPSVLFETLRVNLVIVLPADIKEAENFELLDRQTAMFVLRGRDLPKVVAGDSLSEYFSSKGAIKLILASAGKDLFNYKSQVRRAHDEFEKILRSVEVARTAQRADGWCDNDRQIREVSNLKNDFSALMRQGLVAESQGNLKEALKIYKDITEDAGADEKYKAAAGYQTGLCLLRMGDKEKAAAQFEYIITNYPLQRTAALKSARKLEDIHSGKTDVRTQKQKQVPFVVDTVPGLYLEDADPNIRKIMVIFSEPMKKTDWFYSSFPPVLLPGPVGLPSFDRSGYEWTLPVKLRPGKIYAIAVNCNDDTEKNKDVQAGFRNITGHRCEKFVLVFATADEKQLPTPIDKEIIEKCEKINFPQE